MRVLTIVNQEDAGPGVFAAAAANAGHELVEWAPSTATPPQPDGYGAAMVFGGAMNVDEEDAHPWLGGVKQLIGELVAAGTPVLGVCLGAQLLSEATGGAPGRASRPEIGWHDVELTPQARDDPVVGTLPPRVEAFQWHSYEAAPPDASRVLARSPVCIQAFRVAEHAWGIQFHAEVDEGIVTTWLADYDKDADAVRLGIDPTELLAETRTKIGRWNELGGALCTRFLDFAAAATGGG